MNLQSLYDLKERLEHAAIAGTGLIGEDFRLRRALEAMAPLARANPVFAKISVGAAAMLAAPEKERANRLLDVLSLVDAVVYTQGQTHVAGEITALAPGCGSYVQASYGQLQPLIAALSGGGSGRTALIREYMDTHPEFFGDFRVLPHVIGALGDNYGELADMIGEILLKQGSGIIPMLKDNFDPGGKAEMARRVRLIAKLAGENENHWFVSVLPDSRKEVRETIIHALSLCKENNQLLLDLCRSERGKMKEAAMRSLGAMDSESGMDYLRKEVEKKPASVWCLSGVNNSAASDIAAFAAKQYLISLLENADPLNHSQEENLLQYCAALNGKYSPGLRDLWLWISQNMDAFSEIRYADVNHTAQWLQHCFVGCVLGNPCPEMIKLARELGRTQPEWFLCAEFLADLLCCPPEDVYDAYEKYIIHETLLRKETEDQKNARLQLMMILSLVSWQEKCAGYTLPEITTDPVTGSVVIRQRRIQGLDRRWISHLASHDVVQECVLCAYHPKLLRSAGQTTAARVLMNLIDPKDEQMCQQCGMYYHRRVKMTGELAEYLDVLIKCGWHDWKGLLVHCAQKKTQVAYYEIMEQLSRIPISNKEKAGELRALDEMVRGGRISAQHRIWPQTRIALQIASLESNPDVKI